VQPKAIAFPTDAKLMHRARERLVRLAKKTGVELRQSYERVGKTRADRPSAVCSRQAVQARQPGAEDDPHLSRPGHARHRAQDQGRRRPGERFRPPAHARPPRAQQRQHQREPKVYSLHAPEVECIGKGKAHRPYEFGVKVSLATTLHRSKGGQFIAHAKALPGNPYDGHTLATVIPEIEAQIGATLSRIVADRGYRGHNAPPGHKFKVYISGQRRRVTETIKRELRRRSAVEPVIGHAKSEHRMGRNYLAGTHGDAANAVLAAAGYNFRRLLEWLALLLSSILVAFTAAASRERPLKSP
jgi:IS5 family transposase